MLKATQFKVAATDDMSVAQLVNLLDSFKLKVNVMADQLKLCCVVFHELAIKENVSDHADQSSLFTTYTGIIAYLHIKWYY